MIGIMFLVPAVTRSNRVGRTIKLQSQ